MTTIWILLALGGVGYNTVTVIDRFQSIAHCEAAKAELAKVTHFKSMCLRVENPAPSKTALKVIA